MENKPGLSYSRMRRVWLLDILSLKEKWYSLLSRRSSTATGLHLHTRLPLTMALFFKIEDVSILKREESMYFRRHTTLKGMDKRPHSTSQFFGQ